MTTLFLIGLIVAVGWKLSQVAKAPHDKPLRSVTLCLISAALSYPLAMPGGASGFDTVAGHGAAKLAQNVLLLAAVYFLMCFYLYSAADEQVGRRRARREGILVAVVAVTITVAATTVPHKVFAGSFATTDMSVPQVAVFYLVAGLYLMYALATAAFWTRRFARKSPKPHSTGLWVAGAGMFAMALACAMRAVIVTVRSQDGTVPASLMSAVALLLVVAILLFVFGITYPGVRTRLASYRLWFQHRRAHRRLEPLWTLMAEAFPHSVLPADSSSRRAQWRDRGVHRRYHRRLVECRDGLVQISPYFVDDRADAPEHLAQRLRAAVQAHQSAAAVPTPARPLGIPQQRSLDSIPRQRSRDADVQELLILADALRVSS
ncbi:MAB_1171c family putative transporter [Streptomyces sp. NPDC050095]|uniref:MAB_1171c family putative transporter n=1 Tax=unclassified Streptomyces TaxID=2593676 RepID=UPI003413249C